VSKSGKSPKYQRVTLARPLPARTATGKVFLVDLSRTGVRVAHQGAVPAMGQICRLEFDWEDRAVVLDCKVMRNELVKLARSAAEKSIYHAGLHIEQAHGDSDATLRELIADVVARALDEQKANARGIPAEAAQVFQTSKGTDYLRCELVDGTWRRTATTRPDQPQNGFTVSADEDRQQIEMLCDTFAKADVQGQKLIRTMAELSISRAEGIPTRRYKP
jgi:hypothetical protein